MSPAHRMPERPLQYSVCGGASSGVDNAEYPSGSGTKGPYTQEAIPDLLPRRKEGLHMRPFQENEELADPQLVPIKVYRSDERITLAAPMPGLEAEDIQVEITADGWLILDGRLRGVLKGTNQILADEWNPGPYRREYALPEAVNGLGANVTYGNGVVVVVLPLSSRYHAAHLELTPLPHDRGMRIGHVGKWMPSELAYTLSLSNIREQGKRSCDKGWLRYPSACGVVASPRSMTRLL
jgi:HSP20 family protein